MLLYIDWLITLSNWLHNCEIGYKLSICMSEEIFWVNWIEAGNWSVDQKKVTFIGKGEHFNYDEIFRVQTGYLRTSNSSSLGLWWQSSLRYFYGVIQMNYEEYWQKTKPKCEEAKIQSKKEIGTWWNLWRKRKQNMWLCHWNSRAQDASHHGAMRLASRHGTYCHRCDEAFWADTLFSI